MTTIATLTKPVKLELNNAGSWKTILRFEADDQHAADNALAAAEMLGKVNPRMTWRIASDDGLNDVLMRWSVERGWREEARP